MTTSKDLLSITKDLTILFAEDHKELRAKTDEILKNIFKDVHSVENGAEALKMYKSNPGHYDIVLSDIQMPRLNGVELIESIYKINPDQSIIVISAYDDSKYLLPLINLGIEQFIKKPIDYDELKDSLMRTAKKLQLSNKDFDNSNKSLVTIGKSCTYDKYKNLLRYNDNLISLTKYEIVFIQLLSDNPGKIYTNEDIVEKYRSIDEKLDMENIRKIVSKLRKKIAENSIESIYGIGYRLIPYSN